MNKSLVANTRLRGHVSASTSYVTFGGAVHTCAVQLFRFSVYLTIHLQDTVLIRLQELFWLTINASP